MSENIQRVAIVTGAGSGVGRQTVGRLAREGFHVVLIARTKETLTKTAQWAAEQDAVSRTVRLLELPTDISDASAVQRVIETTNRDFGRIDAIANVAGFAPLLPMEKVTPEIWRQCVDTNLSAIVNMTSIAWPIFKKQKSGVIVNISSMASVDPFPQFSIYAAAKAGVNMFTQCTGKEGAKLGIKAVCIAPGAINTPMLRSLWTEKMLPNEKTLAPEYIADVVVDCILGKHDFKPGETIFVPSP